MFGAGANLIFVFLMGVICEVVFLAVLLLKGKSRFWADEKKMDKLCTLDLIANPHFHLLNYRRRLRL